MAKPTEAAGTADAAEQATGSAVQHRDGRPKPARRPGPFRREQHGDIVPEELNPPLRLPAFDLDGYGVPVPAHGGDARQWVQKILVGVNRILAKKGFLNTDQGQAATAFLQWARSDPKFFTRQGGPGLVFHLLSQLLRDVDGDDATQDALAALIHAGLLGGGMKLIESHPDKTARLWFEFGTSYALYLGAAAARLNLLRWQNLAVLGNKRLRMLREAGKTRWKLQPQRWAAWRAEGEREQVRRSNVGRPNLSKIALAKVVKKNLTLSESVETIRKRL